MGTGKKHSGSGLLKLLTTLLVVASVIEVGVLSKAGLKMYENNQENQVRAAQYAAYQEQQEQERGNPSAVQYAGPEVQVQNGELVKGEWELAPPLDENGWQYEPQPIEKVEIEKIKLQPVEKVSIPKIEPEEIPSQNNKEPSGKKPSTNAIKPTDNSGQKSGTGSSTPSGGGTGNAENFNKYNNVDQQNTEAAYVLNTNTKKFHYPTCRDVPKIAEKNYSTSNDSRESIINSGYSPCKHCNP